MELGIGGIGKTMFPAWTAALTLVKDHGIDAAMSAKNAATTGDVSARLDNAVLALTSFDHAIDNTRKLPVQWVIPRAEVYFRGYDAAKQAVTLLVTSGAIPGAKEKLGRQSLVAARDTFLAGAAASQSETGAYAKHLAGGWLEATAEDALTAVKLLGTGSNTGRDLLAGINQARLAVDKGRLDQSLVNAVTILFDRAGAELGQVVAKASAAAFRPAAPIDPALIARTNALFAEVEKSARVLVDGASKVGQKIEKAG